MATPSRGPRATARSSPEKEGWVTLSKHERSDSRERQGPPGEGGALVPEEFALGDAVGNTDDGEALVVRDLKSADDDTRPHTGSCPTVEIDQHDRPIDRASRVVRVP